MLVGCSGNQGKPEHLIPEKEYIDLLVEFQLIRSYRENAVTDSADVDSLIQAVCKRYSITIEQFRESHKYYQQFPQKQKERVEKAIEELKMDQVKDSATINRKIPERH